VPAQKRSESYSNRLEPPKWSRNQPEIGYFASKSSGDIIWSCSEAIRRHLGMKLGPWTDLNRGFQRLQNENTARARRSADVNSMHDAKCGAHTHQVSLREAQRYHLEPALCNEDLKVCCANCARCMRSLTRSLMHISCTVLNVCAKSI
jgi:hypothetical protein